MARRFDRVALVLVVIAIGLALGELGLRLLGLPRSGPFLQVFRGERFELMAYDSNPSGAFDLDLEDPGQRDRLASRLADPEAFRAHWQDTPWAVSIERNARGFRERELAPKSPGTRRVVILGDGFTVGHGLPNTLSYPRLLESRLQRLFEHDRTAASLDPRATSVEVLNLGAFDTDLPASLRSADFALRELDPDVLVYGHSMIDPGRDLEPSPSMTRIGQSERGRSHVVDWMRRLRADRNIRTSTISGYQRLREPAVWEATLSQIAGMAQAARAQGARFILLLLPPPLEIVDSTVAALHRRIGEAASGAGIEVVDALPALSRHPDEALRLHPRDHHPSPLYTRVVAELLAPVVIEALASGGSAGPPSPESSPERGRERSGK